MNLTKRTATRTRTSRTTAAILVAATLGVTAIGTLQSTPAHAQTAAVYTDLWWNAAESGWGLNLNHQNDIIFATWFTYGANNAAQWFVMSDLRRQPDGSFTGIVYQTTGVPFNQINGASATRAVNNVGTATLRFSSASAGTFSYTVNGVTQSKNITRQPLIQTPTSCTQQAASASRAASQNYQDLWYIPAESGWGVNLTHQGDILFATWFTYRADGTGQWLVASNVARQSDGSYTGILYRTTGLNFSAINNAASSTSVTNVGTITFRFSNGENGVMSYTLDGVSGTKNIVRQVFGSTVNVCTNPASTVTPTTPPGGGGVVSGSCVNTYDFTTGNTYVYRSTPATGAATDALHTIKGPGTFQGRSVIVVEIRNLINGQPDTQGYTNLYYEERGSTIGVIGAQTFINSVVTAQSTTVYNPVDYAPKVLTVGQSFGGSFTASTDATTSGFTSRIQTVYSYQASVAANENVTVPAGTFATCRTNTSNVSTRTTFTINLPVPVPGLGGYDYTCNASGSGNMGSIGQVKSTVNTASCTGTFPQGVTGTSFSGTSTTELVRATVNGRSYP
jgi:hypothetical protein